MNNSTILDPLSRLPIETFTHLFPFLPIFDVAKSSAVSRNWREAILSDSTLHQEVDLTRLTSEDTNVIIVHLDRLSSRSLHRLVKVSLNLTAFYREYLGGKLKAGNASDSLVRCLSRSTDNLKRISLKIEGNEGEMFGYLSSHILSAVLRFPSLKAIFLEVDQFIKFQVGEDIPSSKMFSVTRNTHSKTFAIPSGNFDQVLEVIEAAAAFVGNTLSELFFNWVSLRAPDGRLTIELIRKHSSTLQKLSINLRDLDSTQKRGLLCAAASCPELTHLSITLPKDEADDGADALNLLEGLKCCKLKELDLATNLNLDWESLSKWCASSLEGLRICIGSTTSAGPILLISESRSTLRSLDLEFLDGEVERVFSDSLPSCPNLSSLSLKKASSSSLKLFSNLDVNGLLFLTIHASEETKTDAFNCLYSLLKKYAANLWTLTLENVEYEKSSLSPMAGINFNDLFSLTLDSCGSNLFDWLSSLSYPKLISLNSTGSAESDQAKARFKLNSPILSKISIFDQQVSSAF